MTRLIAGLFAAAMLAAAPAWADKDRGHGYGHDKHAEKQWKKEQKHREKEWRKQEKHAWKHQDQHYYAPPRRVVVEQHYYHYVEPAPVYAAPVYAPPAGIHVVLPNIHIPIR